MLPILSSRLKALNKIMSKLSVIIPKTQFVPFFFLPLKVCFNFFTSVWRKKAPVKLWDYRFKHINMSSNILLCV